MTLSLTQEIEQVANEAKDRVSGDDSAVCLIHHINEKQNVSLNKLFNIIKDCRGSNVTRKQVQVDLEKLALAGLVLMYLNNTYDLTAIGKKVLQSLRNDPYPRKR